MSNLRVPFSASRSVPHFLLIHFGVNQILVKKISGSFWVMSDILTQIVGQKELCHRGASILKFKQSLDSRVISWCYTWPINSSYTLHSQNFFLSTFFTISTKLILRPVLFEGKSDQVRFVGIQLWWGIFCKYYKGKFY